MSLLMQKEKANSSAQGSQMLIFVANSRDDELAFCGITGRKKWILVTFEKKVVEIFSGLRYDNR